MYIPLFLLQPGESVNLISRVIVFAEDYSLVDGRECPGMPVRLKTHYAMRANVNYYTGLINVNHMVDSGSSYGDLIMLSPG